MNRLRCYEMALSLLCFLLVLDLCLTQSCGKRKVVQQLIVNGTKAKDGQWPWHAAIFHNKGLSFAYVCGGTILDRNTVLTAAHCVMTANGLIARKRLTVQVGRHRISVGSNRAQELEAFALIVHPEYKASSIKHDIALIILDTDITYNDYIQPICLWNRRDDIHLIVGSWGTVIGFGIDETYNVSDTLREASIPVVSYITCLESNRDLFGSQLTSNMFCAGNRNGISPCNGDSGGGLFFKYNDVWFIRGIVSFTKPLQHENYCDPKEYTVFTDVAKYLKWIEQHVTGTVDKSTVTTTENNHKQRMTATDVKPIVTGLKNGHKVRLLPMSTCGPNPYSSREELSKPIFLGYPWMGLVECTENASGEMETMCHATLISDFYLITSENCGWRSKLCTRSTVRLGEYDTSTSTDCALVDGELVCLPSVQSIRIESVIMHPGYQLSDVVTDIALIRLRDRADTSQRNVKPICLPVTNELRHPISTHYTMTAWNLDPNFDSVTPVLDRSLREFLVSTECQKLYKNYIRTVATHHICTKFKFEACNNAIGSAPLQLVQQVQGESRYVLYGIHSLDWVCSYGLPTLFTNVASYVDWILENMQE